MRHKLVRQEVLAVLLGMIPKEGQLLQLKLSRDRLHLLLLLPLMIRVEIVPVLILRELLRQKIIINMDIYIPYLLMVSRDG